jgi:rare lipoprotein A (peptidoglycan hydrolase)
MTVRRSNGREVCQEAGCILAVLAALCASAFVLPILCVSADAAGWGAVHRYVRKTGQCEGAREVLASYYATGSRTASGERFNAHGLTAASHDYALGTVLSIKNPHTGRACSIRINDRGPHGLARRTGARLDFALGAARCLGMRGTQYVCAP